MNERCCGLRFGALTRCLALLIGVSAVFLLPGASAAQVNTEGLRKDREQDGIAGRLGLLLAVTKGNSDFTELSVNPSLVARSDAHLLFSISEFSSVFADGNSVVNEGFSHLRYNYSLSRVVVYELFVQAQYDKSQLLSERYLAGTGIRLNLIDREKLEGAIGVSSMYEWETLTTGTSTDLVRSSNYVSMNFIHDKTLTLSSTLYIQPAWRDIGDMRVLAEVNVTFNISSLLGFTAEFDYRRDAQPPPGTKNYDFTLKNGITLRF